MRVSVGVEGVIALCFACGIAGFLVAGLLHEPASSNDRLEVQSEAIQGLADRRFLLEQTHRRSLAAALALARKAIVYRSSPISPFP
jgi:hypothetical protein